MSEGEGERERDGDVPMSGDATATEPGGAAAGSGTEALVDPIDVAWKRLGDRWDDDGAHAKLLSVGAADARLGEIVALYRRVAEDGSRSDADRAIARKKMEGAAFLAVQMMEATKSKRREMPRVRPGVIVAAFVTIALGGLLVWAATHQ